VAARFIDSIAAIANGALGAAAARVEQTMAGMLVLVIGFLARQANLGNVGQAVTGFIRRLRAPIERALDRVIAFVVAQARRLGRFVAQVGVPNDPRERLRLAARDAVRLARPLRGRATEPLLKGALQLLITRYALTRLTVRRQGQAWVAHIVINPDVTPVIDPGSTTAPGAAPAAATATTTAPGEMTDAELRSRLGMSLFSRKKLEGILGRSKSTALRRIDSLKSSGLLVFSSAETDVGTLYTFDPAKAGMRTVNRNNRSIFGYSNPDKTSSEGMQILSKKFSDRIPEPTPAERTSVAFHTDKAFYDSWNTGTKYFPFPIAILGHAGTGASGHWNTIGHTQTKEQNRIWNKNPANYGGPEHKDESSASGGKAERYIMPSEDRGSHESWWK
jgi:hypothetical protein